MSTLAELQKELANCEGNVITCDTMLQLDPDDVDAKETKAIVEEQIAELKAQIAAERAKQSTDAPPPPPGGEDVQKYDMSKHPKFRKQSPDAPPPPPGEDSHQPPAIFNVKDVVMAKYTEDKQWYQATVVSRTGSSADPVYTVTFKGYGNTETKRKHEIRPMNTENKKRKADGAPAASSVPPTPASPMPPTANSGAGHVISAAPSVDHTLVQQTAKREPSKVSDGPTRMAPEPKKLKGNKALEKGKASWQDWQQKGAKKTVVTAPKMKESMFRTGTDPNARVGFVGQGRTAAKNDNRSKWNFSAGGAAAAEED